MTATTFTVGQQVGIVTGVQAVDGPHIARYGVVVRIEEFWVGKPDYIVRTDDGDELVYPAYLLRAVDAAAPAEQVVVRPAQDLVVGDRIVKGDALYPVAAIAADGPWVTFRDANGQVIRQTGYREPIRIQVAAPAPAWRAADYFTDTPYVAPEEGGSDFPPQVFPV